MWISKDLAFFYQILCVWCILASPKLIFWELDPICSTSFEMLEILLKANFTDFRTKGSMSWKRPINSDEIVNFLDLWSLKNQHQSHSLQKSLLQNEQLDWTHYFLLQARIQPFCPNINVMSRNLENLFYTIDYWMFKSKCIVTYHIRRTRKHYL